MNDNMLQFNMTYTDKDEYIHILKRTLVEVMIAPLVIRGQKHIMDTMSPELQQQIYDSLELANCVLTMEQSNVKKR